MNTKKSVAILGASGNMGSALAKKLAAGNYRLLLHGKDHERISRLAKEIMNTEDSSDVETMNCNYDASWEADIIILAVPFKAEMETVDKIREVANRKIVVSISNPLNENFDELVTSPESSAAEELQKLLPHSKVVKAFNTTFAASFSNPLINGKQLDAFIAGNDEEAVQTVADIVRTVGFNPVFAGDLTMSRVLERMQLLLIRQNLKNNYNWQAGWKILHN